MMYYVCVGMCVTVCVCVCLCVCNVQSGARLSGLPLCNCSLLAVSVYLRAAPCSVDKEPMVAVWRVS